MSDLSKKLLGSPVIELAHKDATIDTKSLCGSKHEAWVWVTDEDEDGVPNALEDSIIIGFKGLDSSGAGCIDAIMQGSLIYITDPDEWNSVVSEGMDILQQRYNDCQGFTDCTGALISAGTYAGIYGATYVAQPIIDYAIVKPTTWGLSKASSGWKKAKSWFSSEQFRSEIDTNITNCNILSPDGATTGTLYHNQNGDEHRVKITVNKLYQGITTKVHEVELAGGTVYKKIDNKLWFEPVYKKLKLTGPGTYTIQVESLAANQDCGTPELNFTTSVEVLPSANNQEEETTTTEDTVGSLVASTGVRPLYVYGGIILFGGLLLSKLYSPK